MNIETKPSLLTAEELERLTKQEVHDLGRAEAALAKAQKAKNQAAMQPARKKIDSVSEGVRRRVTAAQRREARLETVALARGRGEDVDDRGPVTRMLSRQGIQQAYEDGHMTPAHGPLTADHLWTTARAYREAYEIARGLAGGEGGGGGGYGAKGPQIRLVEAGQALAIMQDSLTQRQVDVLDRVCGLDMRLREAATVLRRGFPSTKNSLISGLELATLSLRAAKAIQAANPPEVPTKRRLEVARAQIDQAMRSAGH
jgi:hypothetical protein